MTLQMIQCSLTVAEKGNFTRAAEILYISQPAVTKYITGFEEELQLKLFDRSNKRSVQLTPEGEIIYKSLLKCEKEFENGLEKASREKYGRPIIY